MRNPNKGVAILAAGLVGSASFGALLEGFDKYVRPNNNPKVEACAAHLGNISITSSVLPMGCKDMANLFGYRTTVVDTYSSGGELSATEETNKEFIIPTKADFLRQNYVTQADRTANKELDWVLGGFAGIGVATVVGLGLRGRSKLELGKWDSADQA